MQNNIIPVIIKDVGYPEKQSPKIKVRAHLKARLTRMLQEARDRRHDADILGRSFSTRSDSQAFLRVLAFEVLLKAAVLASGSPRAGGHNYIELWDKLPPTARTEIMAVARNRMPGHSDLSDLSKLLFWYQIIFERARYGYELYDGYGTEEVRQLGDYWEELGAPVEEALLRYYPSELECLTDGLIKYVENAL